MNEDFTICGLACLSVQSFVLSWIDLFWKYNIYSCQFIIINKPEYWWKHKIPQLSCNLHNVPKYSVLLSKVFTTKKKHQTVVKCKKLIYKLIDKRNL